MVIVRKREFRVIDNIARQIMHATSCFECIAVYKFIYIKNSIGIITHIAIATTAFLNIQVRIVDN